MFSFLAEWIRIDCLGLLSGHSGNKDSSPAHHAFVTSCREPCVLRFRTPSLSGSSVRASSVPAHDSACALRPSSESEYSVCRASRSPPSVPPFDAVQVTILSRIHTHTHTRALLRSGVGVGKGEGKGSVRCIVDLTGWGFFPEVRVCCARRTM